MPKATHSCPTPNRANTCWWQRLLAAALVRGDWLVDILQCQRGEDHLPFPTSSSGLIRPTHDLAHETPHVDRDPARLAAGLQTLKRGLGMVVVW